MKGDVYSFMMTVTTTMYKRSNMTALGLPLEGNPALKHGDDKDPSSSLVRPPSAPRSKTTRRKKR